MRAFAVILCGALGACGAIQQQQPPEQRVQTVEVRVPVPVPCFTEAERPLQAPPTPIDLDQATTDQKAAALAADNANDELYMRAVEALFLKCQQGKEIK